jgi:hypothetical protein
MMMGILDVAIPRMKNPGELTLLRDRLMAAFALEVGKQVWGNKVFELRVPLSITRIGTKGKSKGKTITRALAPTLNVYKSMKTWQRLVLAEDLDHRILAEIGKWPRSLLRNKPRARGVRATRYSSAMTDEVSLDLIAKMHVDRMVHAGILKGDSVKDIEREAFWKRAAPGHGYLVVEVFELCQPGMGGAP